MTNPQMELLKRKLKNQVVAGLPIDLEELKCVHAYSVEQIASEENR